MALDNASPLAYQPEQVVASPLKSLAQLTTLEALAIWYSVTERSLREMKYDLSARQLGILLSIYLVPPPHTVKTLSARLNISKPAVCRALKVLSSSGLIKKKRDEEDKRNVFVQRSIKGTVYLSELADIIVKVMKAC